MLLLLLILAQAHGNDLFARRGASLHLQAGSVDFAPRNLERVKELRTPRHASLLRGDRPISLEQWVVHLKTPISAGMLKDINEMLAPYYLGEYLPHNSYLLVAPESVAAGARQLSGVVYVLHFAESFKLSPNLYKLYPSLKQLVNNVNVSPSPSSASSFASSSTSPPKLKDALRVHLAPSSRDDQLPTWTQSWVRDLSVALQAQSCFLRVKLRLISAIQLLIHVFDGTKNGSSGRGNEYSGISSVNSSSGRGNEYSGISSVNSSSGASGNSSNIHSDESTLTTADFGKCLARVIHWLAQQPLVHWIERQSRFAPLNKWAHIVTQTDEPGNPLIWKKGLRGEGQIIAMADTGLDYDSCFFFDPNVSVPLNSVNFTHRKIVRYVTVPDEEMCVNEKGGDQVDGHGTHTAGTVAGEALTSDPMAFTNLSAYNGMAYKAKLCIYDYLTCPQDSDLYLPTDIYQDFYNDSYHVGHARISSNSWGDEGGDYDSYTWDSDRFMFDFQHYLVVFAAGNSGKNGFFSITIPGISKNALTVGSCHNHAASDVESGQQYGLSITLPFDITANIQVLSADFGPPFSSLPLTTAPLTVTPTPEGCGNYTEWEKMNGTVAIVWRGTCEFYIKVMSAQKSGAVLLVVVNNVVTAPEIMYGPERANTSDVTIPLVMISKADGDRLFRRLDEIQLRFPVQIAPVHQEESYLSSFSSRGPTADGRLKPDIVAPGQPIKSTKSDGNLNSFQCRDDPSTLIAMSGTSMAAPVAAGAAALVRQYFVDGVYPALSSLSDVDPQRFSDPLAALVKATVIHAGVAIGGQVNSINVTAPPSLFQGHGRIQLDTVLVFDKDQDGKADDGVQLGLWVKEGLVNHVGQVDLFCFHAGVGSNVKATLVWMDPPAVISALFVLVNDLDLAIIDSPRAAFGNTMPGAEDILDSVNNVEVARLPSTSGTFLVRVSTIHLPSNQPQPYGLVVTANHMKRVDLTACKDAHMCIHNCSGHGRCEPGGRCLCDPLWVGDDCSHQPIELLADSAPLRVAVGVWESKYFYYQGDPKGALLIIHRTSNEGDPDWFVNKPTTKGYPSPHHWDLADQTCDACLDHSSNVPLNLSNSGLYKITVYGYCCDVSEFSIQVTGQGQPRISVQGTEVKCKGLCEMLLIFSPALLILAIIILAFCCCGVVLCVRKYRQASRHRFTQLVTQETDTIMGVYGDKETIELVDKYYVSDDELDDEESFMPTVVKNEVVRKTSPPRVEQKSSIVDAQEKLAEKKHSTKSSVPKTNSPHALEDSSSEEEDASLL